MKEKIAPNNGEFAKLQKGEIVFNTGDENLPLLKEMVHEIQDTAPFMTESILSRLYEYIKLCQYYNL